MLILKAMLSVSNRDQVISDRPFEYKNLNVKYIPEIYESAKGISFRLFWA